MLRKYLFLLSFTVILQTLFPTYLDLFVVILFFQRQKSFLTVIPILIVSALLNMMKFVTEAENFWSIYFITQIIFFSNLPSDPYFQLKSQLSSASKCPPWPNFLSFICSFVLNKTLFLIICPSFDFEESQFWRKYLQIVIWFIICFVLIFINLYLTVPSLFIFFISQH